MAKSQYAIRADANGPFTGANIDALFDLASGIQYNTHDAALWVEDRMVRDILYDCARDWHWIASCLAQASGFVHDGETGCTGDPYHEPGQDPWRGPERFSIDNRSLRVVDDRHPRQMFLSSGDLAILGDECLRRGWHRLGTLLLDICDGWLDLPPKANGSARCTQPKLGCGDQ